MISIDVVCTSLRVYSARLIWEFWDIFPCYENTEQYKEKTIKLTTLKQIKQGIGNSIQWIQKENKKHTLILCIKNIKVSIDKNLKNLVIIKKFLSFYSVHNLTERISKKKYQSSLSWSWFASWKEQDRITFRNTR